MSASLFILAALSIASGDPRAAVVSVSQPKMYPVPRALALADELGAALAREGVAIAIDAKEAKARAKPEACGSSDACLAEAARVLDVEVIVAVDAAELRGDLAVHVFAIAKSEGRRIYEKTFVATAESRASNVAAEAKALAELLRPLLAEAAPPPPPPREEPAKPGPPEEPPQLAPRAEPAEQPSPPIAPAVHEVAPERDRTPAWIAAATGAALAATGAILWVVAKNHESSLRDGDPSISTAAERTAVRESGERAQTFAFIFAGAGAASLAAAAVMFTVDF